MVSKPYFFLLFPSTILSYWSLSAFLTSICSEDTECGCCCCVCTVEGRARRTSKVIPYHDQEPNFSALFVDQHSVSVKYFRIKEAFSDRTVGADKFMILGVAYSIVEFLDFVGWHLPLKHSRSAHTFQSIIDYFSEFESGVDKIQDPYRVMMKFGMIYSLRHPIPY